MLDGRALNCVPINNAPGTVMTMMDPSNVVNVFVAGKLVKHNGNLVGVDVEKLKREVELSSERVLERIMSVPIR
jgi:TATA-box binding protein (TBP) (component of TFIID and TFIIIB)